LQNPENPGTAGNAQIPGFRDPGINSLASTVA